MYYCDPYYVDFPLTYCSQGFEQNSFLLLNTLQSASYTIQNIIKYSIIKTIIPEQTQYGNLLSDLQQKD